VSSFLVISDPHSNPLALHAVLAAAAEHGPYERILCAGDLVGYGWDPNAVVETARDRGFACVLGNHDWAVLSEEPVDMHWSALKAALHNHLALREDCFRYLRSLSREPWVSDDGAIALVHGSFSPGAGMYERQYVTGEWEALDAMRALAAPDGGGRFGKVRVAIHGHTHVPAVGRAWFPPEPGAAPLGFRFEQFDRDDAPAPDAPPVRVLAPGDAPEGTNGALRPILLLNPGSVGQPRDGDPAASFVVLRIGDDEVRVEFHRAEYDVAGAQRRMREHPSLPEDLIHRLSLGR